MSPTRKSEEGDDYLAKRSRNNAAVRRSREKARMKSKETDKREREIYSERERV